MRTLFVISITLVMLSGCAPIQSAGPTYDVAVTRGGSAWYAIRYDARTGASWFAEENALRELGESSPVPAGRYKVVMADKGDGFGAIRLEERSGRVWVLVNYKWRELTPRKPDA